jgi:hypothetical protein
MWADFTPLSALRRPKRPHFRGSGFDSLNCGEFAKNIEEKMPRLVKARFTLFPGIVNLVTTVYIRAKL